MDNQEVHLHYDLETEINRLIREDSLSDGNPLAVIVMGGICAGKSCHIQEKYAHTGYVLIDAAELFHHLSGEYYFNFPDGLLEPLEWIGSMVANKAIRERRHIVTELAGDDSDSIVNMIDKLKSLGYAIKIDAIECNPDEAALRNHQRGDNISSYHAEPFQIKWITQACQQALQSNPAANPKQDML